MQQEFPTSLDQLSGSLPPEMAIRKLETLIFIVWMLWLSSRVKSGEITTGDCERSGQWFFLLRDSGKSWNLLLSFHCVFYLFFWFKIGILASPKKFKWLTRASSALPALNAPLMNKQRVGTHCWALEPALGTVMLLRTCFFIILKYSRQFLIHKKCWFCRYKAIHHDYLVGKGTWARRTWDVHRCSYVVGSLQVWFA